MEELLRKVVSAFEADSGLKVDRLMDFRTPFPSEEDLMLEVAVVGSEVPAFVRFTEEGKLIGWGRVVPSGRTC